MQKDFKTIQQNMRLGQVTRLGFGTILLTMIGIGLITKISTNTLVESTDWVTHTYEVKARLRALEKDLVDAETGQRGFIFTGKENFLEPYHQSTRVIKTGFMELRELVKDNPQQVTKIKAVEELAQKKLDELSETIALKRAGKEQELREVVLSEKGKQIMDDVRAKLGEAIEVEEQLLVKRQEAAKQAEQISTLVSLGGTSAAIFLGLACLAYVGRKVIQPINEVANILVTSSTEIATTVEQHERTAAQQAASVHQTTTTMDELGASSRQSAEQAEAAAAGARQVLALVDGSIELEQQTTVERSSLRNRVIEISEQILHLSEQTSQIGSISNAVSDLANQTNMLALNAAVEAVRAGEQGKGFGVVAGEIRKLADESRKSADKINTLVSDIQKAMNSTVMVTDEGTKTVTSIVVAINDIAANSQQISLTAKQQAVAIQQVVGAMNELNQGAVQTACGLTQTKVSTQQLNAAALNLKSVV